MRNANRKCFVWLVIVQKTSKDKIPNEKENNEIYRTKIFENINNSFKLFNNISWKIHVGPERFV